MVTTDVEIELRKQLREAGKQLSNPPSSVDDLFHILDQTEKLLSKVDQSPNALMHEALGQLVKALVDERLLKHSSTDVKVTVASCMCEMTRITAPEAPYGDEEMKGVFKLIVSSFENLSDESSRTYDKTISIIDIVCKVRACVIMLDLECDDLIVKMFEHFLTSVRDHHIGKIFLSMRNIMALVLEESEEISLDMLKPLLSSIKNNSEGVLPVARKLGEEVVKQSADKLRPCLKEALMKLGVSLDNYSKVLTMVYEGKTNFEHYGEESPVHPKADESKLAPALDDVAQVTNNGKMVASLEDGLDDKESEKAIDHPDSDPTNSVAKKSVKILSKPEETSDRKGMKSSELADSSHDDAKSKSEKDSDMTLSDREEVETEAANVETQSQRKGFIKKGIRSNKKSSGQTPSTNIAPEGIKDPEVLSLKRVRKKTPKAEENKPSATSGSAVEPLKKAPEVTSDSEIRSQKRARKKTAKADDFKPPATDGSDVEPLIKAPEVTSDSEIRSQKRARKKTTKADDSKPSATSGSDVEPLKKASEDTSDSEIGSQKRARKKTVKADDSSDSDVEPLINTSKKVEAVVSESKLGKRSSKKVSGAYSMASGGSDTEVVKKSSKKLDSIDSGPKPVKSSGKKVTVADSVVTSDLVPELLKKSTKKVETVDSGSKSSKRSIKKVIAKDSVAEKAKQSGKKTDGGESQSKNSKPAGEKVDSEVKSAKQSDKKESDSDSDDKPLKQAGKKGVKGKVTTKSNEDIISAEEEIYSDDEPLKVSPKKDESDSDDKPLKVSSKKGNKSSHVVKSSIKKKVEKKNQPTPEDDDMDVTLKSVLKTATKGEGKLKELSKISSKRKRSDDDIKGNTPKSSQDKKIFKYDDSLVGQKVKIWWPKDKMFYEGEVTSFDAAKKKHKVLYLDGVDEDLVLRKQKWGTIEEYTQKWEIVEEDSAPNEENAAEVEEERSIEDVSATPKKKKKKEKLTVTLGLFASQEKNSKVSAKRAGGASASGKSKGPASKSGGSKKGKEEAKAENKSEEVDLKEDENSKEVEMSKEDENAKEDEEMKKKEERPKIVYKSKGKKNKSKTSESEEKAVASEATM